MSKYNIALISFVFLIPFRVLGGGLPVVDTRALFQDMSDSIYTLSAVEDLLTEFNVSSNDMKALLDLRNELNKLNEDLHLFKDAYGELQDLSSPYFYKARILADYITQVTQYVRKVKRFMILAQSMQNRPQALTAVLAMIREQREREKDQFEAAMRSVEEKEKVQNERSKIRKRIEARRRLDQEYSQIASDKSATSLPVGKIDSSRRKGSLW
jgi:hypothetical protein